MINVDIKEYKLDLSEYSYKYVLPHQWCADVSCVLISKEFK